MASDYTFLNDHSYSLRPNTDDNDELPSNQQEVKSKNHRRSSNRTNKTTSTTNRTVSIDRSSSDKENNSLILSSSSDVPLSTISTSINKTKSSTNVRSNQKKSIGSRRSRLSARTAMINSRTQSGKSKTGVKLTQGSIVKKKKVNNRGKSKPLAFSHLDLNDAPPSLSIEERVKLRRTIPLQSSPTIMKTKPVSTTKSRITKTLTRNNHTVQQDIKQIRQSIKTSSEKEINKTPKTSTKKLFLGSGLDLDNIVPGNRQRRCVQT